MDLIQKIKEQGNQASVLLPVVMQNNTYKKIRESAEALGWGSIVNAILSSDVFNNGIVDITAYKTTNSLMEAIISFANAIKDTIGPEAISNLPYNTDDEDEIGKYDKAFGIPVTFVGIHNLSERGLEETRVDSSTGKIVIHRDGNRDDVYIEFMFFFHAGTDICEYRLTSDGSKNHNSLHNHSSIKIHSRNNLLCARMDFY